MPIHVPEEDEHWRPTKKWLGPEGQRASTSLEIRDSSVRRHSTIHGLEYRLGPTAIRDRELQTEADKQSAKPHFLHRYTLEKPTHDYPKGGKCTAPFVHARPNPIADPTILKSITGKPKRLEPLTFTDEQTKKTWSDGRASRIRQDADLLASKPNVIPYLGVARPGAAVDNSIKAGTKMVPHGHDVKPDNFVAGFRGVGNSYERVIINKQNPAMASQTHAVMGMRFEGARRNDYGPPFGHG